MGREEPDQTNKQKENVIIFGECRPPGMLIRFTKQIVVVETIKASESLLMVEKKQNEPRHEISNNVVCATSKASDQPAHTRSLIRAFPSR